MFSLQRFEHFDVSSMVDVSTGHVKVLFARTMKKKIHWQCSHLFPLTFLRKSRAWVREKQIAPPSHNFYGLCTFIEHSSRPISGREIARLLLKWVLKRIEDVWSFMSRFLAVSQVVENLVGHYCRTLISRSLKGREKSSSFTDCMTFNAMGFGLPRQISVKFLSRLTKFSSS